MTQEHRAAIKVTDLTGEALGDTSTTHRCKFVLVESAGEIHLVFGLLSRYPYHANLVEAFCRRFAIPSGWERRPDLYALYTKVARIRGGGYLVFEPAARRAEVFGYSTSYGRFDKKLMKAALAGAEVFAAWTVNVR